MNLLDEVKKQATEAIKKMKMKDQQKEEKIRILNEHANEVEKYFIELGIMMRIGRKVEPTTEEEREVAEKAQKRFGQLVLKDTGLITRKDVTPYVHILARHLRQFLDRAPHYSLGYYSQEAVEYINSHEKALSKLTNHGGGNGDITWTRQIMRKELGPLALTYMFPEDAPGHLLRRVPKFDDATKQKEKRKPRQTQAERPRLVKLVGAYVKRKEKEGNGK